MESDITLAIHKIGNVHYPRKWWPTDETEREKENQLKKSCRINKGTGQDIKKQQMERDSK